MGYYYKKTISAEDLDTVISELPDEFPRDITGHISRIVDVLLDEMVANDWNIDYVDAFKSNLKYYLMYKRGIHDGIKLEKRNLKYERDMELLTT